MQQSNRTITLFPLFHEAKDVGLQDRSIFLYMRYDRWFFHRRPGHSFYYTSLKTPYYRRNAEEYIAFTRHFSKIVNIPRREKIFIPLCL